MRITELTIKNYLSFGPTGQTIYFPTNHCALVGKNNTGKTNVFNALEIVLGYKNPSYIRFEEDDFFDDNQPLEIIIKISDIKDSDKHNLFRIPNLTKQQQGALNAKVADDTADIILHLKRKLQAVVTEEGEDTASAEDFFEVKLWGFTVHRKKEDVRKCIAKILLVPTIRSPKDELTASRWTQFGQLMKDVLESSQNYGEIKALLVQINEKIHTAFTTEKERLLKNTRIMSYVDDIEFQITKDNQPSELLRNLEIFIKERGKLFNIDSVGTGTQSAIILGIFELALKNKSALNRLFCIEEPEAFIHPHGVRYLGGLIKGIPSDSNLQVLVSSHSLALSANFSPNEIIRVDKINGETKIFQNVALPIAHFKRFVNQENVEMFFCDKVIFVEGVTEKFILSDLCKATKQNPAVQTSDDCNFDRQNTGIIKLNSKDNILNYIKIAESFGIQYVAILDKDFIHSPKCRELCQKFNINYDVSNEAKLINDLKAKNILVITKGEVEDLIPNQDVVNMTGKTLQEVQQKKNQYPNKTSDAFKELFNMRKSEYPIKIVAHYIENQVPHPFEDIIRNLYHYNVQNVVI